MMHGSAVLKAAGNINYDAMRANLNDLTIVENMLSFHH